MTELKIIISAVILITSFLTFVWMNAESQLESFSVTWKETTYDINDTVVLDVSTYPSDSKISTLSICDNNIADASYENGKITLTFKELGTSSIYFTANDAITNDTETITVVDEAAEEQKRLEEEQQRQAEEKAAKEEAERLAAEQAAQAEAEHLAAEQAAQEAITQQPQEEMVWIPASGTKYHSRSNCSGMNNPSEVALAQAQAWGYTPCQKCH